MLSRHTNGTITWIDLESPSVEEVRSVMHEFSIEPIVGEELLLPTSKPRVDFHAAYAYVILHFPALRHSHKHREQEIDFVIGHDFLITTHYETVDPLHKFSKVFEVNSVLETSNIGDHAGYVFYAMLKRMYRGIEHELEFVRKDLADIEDHIFRGDEVPMVAAISRSSRDLLAMRQTIEPHRDILHAFDTSGPAIFGADFTPYLRALANEYYKVHNRIMRLTESLHELRETNNSLLTTKQNETMKQFTVMAFLTLPLTLIASLFGMNVEHTPIAGNQFDFWIVVVIMLVTAALLFTFFKKKRWL